MFILGNIYWEKTQGYVMGGWWDRTTRLHQK